MQKKTNCSVKNGNVISEIEKTFENHLVCCYDANYLSMRWLRTGKYDLSEIFGHNKTFQTQEPNFSISVVTRPLSSLNIYTVTQNLRKSICVILELSHRRKLASKNRHHRIFECFFHN